MAEFRKRLEEGLALLAAMAILGVIFGPFFILGRHALGWFRTGEWAPFPFWMLAEMAGINRPVVGWLGVQKMIDWFFELPAALGLALLGGLATYLAGYVVERIQDRRI